MSNYFLSKIEDFLRIERTKEDIASAFRILKPQAELFLQDAMKAGKVEKLNKPVRYIAVSQLPHKQLSVPRL